MGKGNDVSDLTADEMKGAEPAVPVQSELMRLAVAVEELTATLRQLALVDDEPE